jgi:hypothetical protein
MNSAILLQTFDTVGAKIDDLWSMYIVVNLGLMWFFFLIHRPLLIIERVIAWGAYGGFIYVNGGALILAYTKLEAVRLDLTKNFALDFAQAPELFKEMLGQSYDERFTLIAFTHLGALTLVLVLFAFRNSMIQRYYRQFPEQVGQSKSSLMD